MSQRVFKGTTEAVRLRCSAWHLNAYAQGCGAVIEPSTVEGYSLCTTAESCKNRQVDALAERVP